MSFFPRNTIYVLPVVLVASVVVLVGFLNVVPPFVYHSSYLFEPAFFDQAYEYGRSYTKEADGRVYGGILPHHLLAAPLIAGFFQGIEGQPVNTVILLSPNHYNAGPYAISVSKGYWKTLYGTVEPDTKKLDTLDRDGAASVSEELFEYEHGIYGITPFIKRSFPNARIVSVALKSNTTRREADRLVASLENIVDEKTIIIASVDFSHYVSSDEADVYDRESMAAIESFDAQKIFNFDNTKNFDSPASLYTLVRLMERIGAKTTQLVVNTNSAKLTRQPDLPSTTSYVTLYFTKNN